MTVSNEEFIVLWNKMSIKELAEHLGVEPSYVSVRASILRSKGFDLPKKRRIKKEVPQVECESPKVMLMEEGLEKVLETGVMDLAVKPEIPAVQSLPVEVINVNSEDF